jgi:hypothetical protein
MIQPGQFRTFDFHALGSSGGGYGDTPSGPNEEAAVGSPENSLDCGPGNFTQFERSGEPNGFNEFESCNFREFQDLTVLPSPVPPGFPPVPPGPPGPPEPPGDPSPF